MAGADDYRRMARDFQAKAHSNPLMRTEYENLASSYMRLADQVERNEGLTIEFELPPPEKDG